MNDPFLGEIREDWYRADELIKVHELLRNDAEVMALLNRRNQLIQSGFQVKDISTHRECRFEAQYPPNVKKELTFINSELDKMVNQYTQQVKNQQP